MPRKKNEERRGPNLLETTGQPPATKSSPSSRPSSPQKNGPSTTTTATTKTLHRRTTEEKPSPPELPTSLIGNQQGFQHSSAAARLDREDERTIANGSSHQNFQPSATKPPYAVKPKNRLYPTVKPAGETKAPTGKQPNEERKDRRMSHRDSNTTPEMEKKKRKEKREEKEKGKRERERKEGREREREGGSGGGRRRQPPPQTGALRDEKFLERRKREF